MAHIGDMCSVPTQQQKTGRAPMEFLGIWFDDLREFCTVVWGY